MGVEFELLGDVRAAADGAVIELGPARQTCVLIVLLLDSPRAVSVDQLAYRVWGDRVPRSAEGALRAYVSRLRRSLGSSAEIVHTASGYVLQTDGCSVDVQKFRDRTAEALASEDDELAAELLSSARELWRGEPFAGVSSPWLDEVRDQLEAERQSALLELCDIELRLGRHASIIAALTTEMARRPLDERLAGQYLLALYRCGRQAEALSHYDRLRLRLADELGVDPNPALQDLHRKILAADDDVPVAAAGSRRPVPKQLPAAPRLFTGRTRELSAITTLADESTGMICVVTGAGGIGKTTLVLQWAHENLGRFPDGQLFVNLRGFDPADDPMPTASVVRSLLDGLGVVQADLPDGLDEQIGLYRSLVADKRLLVVLDNVRCGDEITSLLPGGRSCGVLITSRLQLGSLVAAHGAGLVAMDVLDDQDASELLTAYLGREQTTSEPDAMAGLIAACAGSPLALALAAARALGNAALPLARLTDELSEPSDRLDALELGGVTTSLRTVFYSSLRALDADTVKAFGLLGLRRELDIGLAPAASLIALPVAEARVVLRRLEQAHLLIQHRPGRYRMPDLVRLYAVERSRQLPEDERVAALRRVADHCGHSDRSTLLPERAHVALPAPAIELLSSPSLRRALSSAEVVRPQAG